MLLEEVKGHHNTVLVGLGLPGQEKEEKLDNLSELSQLAKTAGLEVKHRFVQERARIHFRSLKRKRHPRSLGPLPEPGPTPRP